MVAALSGLEFLIYGGIAYGTLLMLITLAFRNPLSGKVDSSSYKIAFAFPGIICMGMLGVFGVEVEVMKTENYVMNGTELIPTTVEIQTIELKDERWFIIHTLFFLLMILYEVFVIVGMFIEIP